MAVTKKASKKSDAGKQEVAVVASGSVFIPTTRDEVPAAIEALKAKLAELKGNSEEKISTDISYNNRNISKVETVSELLEISSAVQSRNKAFNEEITRFKLEGANVKKFEVSEKNAEDWVKIIAKAINELLNKKQIVKIESAIKELSQHLDAETKLQNTLAGIMGDASQPIA